MDAVENFRASDFPEGKKIKEGTNPVRKDNEILEKEVEHAIRDAKEGEKYMEDFSERVDDARSKLEDEVANTVTPLEQQDEPTKKRSKADGIVDDAEATQHINDEVAKTTYERKRK